MKHLNENYIDDIKTSKVGISSDAKNKHTLTFSYELFRKSPMTDKYDFSAFIKRMMYVLKSVRFIDSYAIKFNIKHKKITMKNINIIEQKPMIESSYEISNTDNILDVYERMYKKDLIPCGKFWKKYKTTKDLPRIPTNSATVNIDFVIEFIPSSTMTQFSFVDGCLAIWRNILPYEEKIFIPQDEDSVQYVGSSDVKMNSTLVRFVILNNDGNGEDSNKDRMIRGWNYRTEHMTNLIEEAKRVYNNVFGADNGSSIDNIQKGKLARYLNQANWQQVAFKLAFRKHYEHFDIEHVKIEDSDGQYCSTKKITFDIVSTKTVKCEYLYHFIHDWVIPKLTDADYEEFVGDKKDGHLTIEFIIPMKYWDEIPTMTETDRRIRNEGYPLRLLINQPSNITIWF